MRRTAQRKVTEVLHDRARRDDPAGQYMCQPVDVLFAPADPDACVSVAAGRSSGADPGPAVIGPSDVHKVPEPGLYTEDVDVAQIAHALVIGVWVPDRRTVARR